MILYVFLDFYTFSTRHIFSVNPEEIKTVKTWTCLSKTIPEHFVKYTKQPLSNFEPQKP